MMLLSWATGLALLATAPAPCAARCPCVQLPGEDWRVPRTVVPRARDEADAIFLGRVVAADTLAWGTFTWPADGTGQSRVQRYPDVVRYTFAVSRQWKGAVGSRVTVVASEFSTDCGRAFAQDGTYLVYAREYRESRGTPGALTSESCDRTLPAAEATEDVALLGRGTVPAR